MFSLCLSSPPLSLTHTDTHTHKLTQGLHRITLLTVLEKIDG